MVVAAETLGYLPRVSMQVILGVAAGIMDNWNVVISGCVRYKE